MWACTCVHMCVGVGCTHATACMLGSEDNFLESGLSCHRWGLRWVKLASRYFYVLRDLVISLVLILSLKQGTLRPGMLAWKSLGEAEDDLECLIFLPQPPK